MTHSRGICPTAHLCQRSRQSEARASRSPTKTKSRGTSCSASPPGGTTQRGAVAGHRWILEFAFTGRTSTVGSRSTQRGGFVRPWFDGCRRQIGGSRSTKAVGCLCPSMPCDRCGVNVPAGPTPLQLGTTPLTGSADSAAAPCPPSRVIFGAFVWPATVKR